MIKALLDYPNLPFLRQPSTAPTARAPIPPLDKHGCRPEEPYISLSLPLPAWAQDNVVQRSLEAVDTWLQYTALAWAVSDGYDMTARVLLEVRACVASVLACGAACVRSPYIYLRRHKHTPKYTGRRRPDLPRPNLLLQQPREADAGGAGEVQGPPRAALEARGTWEGHTVSFGV